MINCNSGTGRGLGTESSLKDPAGQHSFQSQQPSQTSIICQSILSSSAHILTQHTSISRVLHTSTMASSRPRSRRRSAASNSNTEPFPSIPDSPAGPSSNSNGTTTTTTTTVHGPTITTTIHRNRPYTITSSAPPSQTPTSIVSAPDNPVTTTSAGPTTTRGNFLAPAHHVVNTRPISIRRLPSSNLRAGYEDNASQPPSRSASGRGRSTSAPQHLTVPGTGNLTRQSTRQSMLPTVAENPQTAGNRGVDRDTMNENVAGGVGRRRSVSNAARSIISRFSDTSRERQGQGPDYESEVVDLLDVLGKWLWPALSVLC